MNQKGFIYTGNLLQTANYYPSGVPFTLIDDDPVTDRLHTGKPFIDMQGLGYYDNNARFLDILTGSFISVDSLAGKYPSLTPYNHCANNPLSYVDPDGKVLRDQNGNVVYVTDQRQELYYHEEVSYAIVEIGYIFTDNEMPIQVLNNINKFPGWDTNCHGYSFADGKFWINPDQTEILLKNDNYISVDIEDAKKWIRLYIMVMVHQHNLNIL
ncbi:MAG: hypothetical protein IKA19_04595 [Muribaculaceae bacterium]|nr:hypothetical protein [Muribaculaceae bacterium]